MFPDTPYRSKPVLFHRKAYSNCIEEAEYNHRNYLILLSHFSDNLNASIKIFQDCIGDLEEHPKFKLSRSEKQVLDCGLQQLSQAYLERLCKESYYRNGAIRKGYNVFLESYYAKHKKEESPKTKAFTVKSLSQKERVSQRSSLNKQASCRPNRLYQKKQIKRPLFLSKPMLYELNLSTNVEKHNFQGSKILSVKKAAIGINQCRQLTNSTTVERKNSDLEVKGSFVFVSQTKIKDELEQELQKMAKKQGQSLRTNKVVAFRNRISTNPELHQRQKGLKHDRMLRMSLMNIQGNSIRNKNKKAYQQQIRMILNIDN